MSLDLPPRRPAMKRKIIQMPADLVGAVLDYRISARLESEAEAVRDLLRRGLEAQAAMVARTKSVAD